MRLTMRTAGKSHPQCGKPQNNIIISQEKMQEKGALHLFVPR